MLNLPEDTLYVLIAREINVSPPTWWRFSVVGGVGGFMCMAYAVSTTGD